MEEEKKSRIATGEIFDDRYPDTGETGDAYELEMIEVFETMSNGLEKTANS